MEFFIIYPEVYNLDYGWSTLSHKPSLRSGATDGSGELAFAANGPRSVPD
jgi:hypothetical protein